MTRRKCTRCGHADPPLAGRCPVLVSGTTVCGCVCDNPTEPTRQGPPLDLTTHAGAQAILRAVSDGHLHAQSIAAVAGIPDNTVYDLLARLERAGLVVSVWEGRDPAVREHPSQRREYRLTSQ